MRVYNLVQVPITNADTKILGPNPRRVGVIINPAQNMFWVNFWGPGAARTGITVGTEGIAAAPIRLEEPEPNSWLSQEARAFLNAAGPNTLQIVEIIEE